MDSEQNSPPVTPEPIMRGTFAIYETRDGGFHIAYQPVGSDEKKDFEIPGMAVKLMRARMGKNFGNVLGQLGMTRG